jgi:translation initiation factor IF-2
MEDVMKETVVGMVVWYFSKIGVAAIRITSGEVKVGDTIKIKGHTTDFQQVVSSMQVEHEKVEKAEVGKEIGIKVSEHVRENDTVYVVMQDPEE